MFLSSKLDMAIKVLFFLFTADSAYEISSSCMKPFINARSRQQKTFNRKLSGIRTRCTEDLIGIMKRRFPILAQGIRTKLPTAFDIIVACGVLHNLAVFLREPKVDDEAPDDNNAFDDNDENPTSLDPDRQPAENPTAFALREAGRIKRDHLCEQYCT
jgi:hypothetical protein